MSANNGVIRIGRKGLRKFAIGEENDPRQLPAFEVDVVDAFQQWIGIDDSLRPLTPDEDGNRSISTADMPTYHQAAVEFVESLGGLPYAHKLTKAEALDFIARLREQYNELAVFFRPKSLQERDSPATSEAPSLHFSAEEAN
jgi:hypothetical protein